MGVLDKYKVNKVAEQNTSSENKQSALDKYRKNSVEETPIVEKPSIKSSAQETVDSFVAPENNYSKGLLNANFETNSIIEKPVENKLPVSVRPPEAEFLIKQAYTPKIPAINIGGEEFVDDKLMSSISFIQKRGEEEAQKQIDFGKSKYHEDGTPITKEEKDAWAKSLLDVFDKEKQEKQDALNITKNEYANRLSRINVQTEEGKLLYAQTLADQQEAINRLSFDSQIADKKQKDLINSLPEITEINDEFSQGSQNDINYLDKFDDSTLQKKFGEIGIDKTYIGKINQTDNSEAAKLAYNQQQEFITQEDVTGDRFAPIKGTQKRGNPAWVNEQLQKTGGYQVISNYQDLYKQSAKDYLDIQKQYEEKIKEYNENPTKEGYAELENFKKTQLNPALTIVNKRDEDLKRLYKLQKYSYKALDEWEQKQNEELNTDLSTLKGNLTVAARSLANKNSHILLGVQQATGLFKRPFESKEEYISDKIAEQNRMKDATFAIPEQYHKMGITNEEWDKNTGADKWLKGVNWSNLVAQNLEQSAFSMEIAGVTALSGGSVNAIIPATFAMTYGDMLYNAREQGLNENQASSIAAFQSLVEGLTERISPLEAKIFNPETYLGGNLKQLTKEQIIKQLFKTATGKEIKEGALQFLLEKGKETTKKVAKGVATGAYTVLQETAEELAGDPLNQLGEIVASNNIQGYTYDPVTYETLKNTAITSAATMVGMGLWGAITKIREKSISSYRYDLATKPNYYLSSLDHAWNIGQIQDFSLKTGTQISKMELYDKAKKEIKAVSDIYKNNKDVIDNLEENYQQADYVNLMREQQLEYANLAKYPAQTLANPTKEQSKEIEKIQLKINDYQESLNRYNVMAFDNISMPKHERQKIQNEKVLKATTEQFTDKFISNLITEDQVNKFLKNLEDRYTYSPTKEMKTLVDEVSVKLNNRLNEIKNKPAAQIVEEVKQQNKPVVEVKEEVKKEITPIQEFENKIAEASEAQLEELRNEIRLNEELSSDGRRLRNLLDTKKVELQSKSTTTQETPAKKVDEEEQAFGDLITEKRVETDVSNQPNQDKSDNNDIEAKKADIEIGKVGNTEYEVKVDGVYYQGKKLNNPENKTHRQLIEADIERRRQEEKDNIGQKAVQRRLQDLREATSEKQITQAIINIEKNVKAGAKITKEEQDFVNQKKQELKNKGFEIVDHTGKVWNVGMNLEVLTFKTLEEGTNLTQEEIDVLEKELENRKKKREKLKERGLSEQEIDNQLEDTISIMTTVQPQLNKDGKMVQAAKVDALHIEVSQAEEILERSKKNPKNTKQQREDKINAKYDAELANLDTTQQKLSVDSFTQDGILQSLEKFKENSKKATITDLGYKLFGKLYKRVSDFVLNNVVYESNKSVTNIVNAGVTGDYVDLLAREFFKNNDLTYEQFKNIVSNDKKTGKQFVKINTKETFEDIKNQISVVKDKLIDKHTVNGVAPVFVTDELLLSVDTNAITGFDGIAGTTDMIVVDNNGEYFIYDFKTKKQSNSRYPVTAQSLDKSFDGIVKSDTKKWTDQQSVYAKLLEFYIGKAPQSINAIVIPINYFTEDFTGDFESKKEIKDFKPIPGNLESIKPAFFKSLEITPNVKLDGILNELTDEVEEEQLPSAITDEKQPIVVNTIPVADSKEADKIAKKQVEKEENTSNTQFKTLYSKSSNWEKVVSKLHKLTKSEILSKYRLKVVNARDVEFSSLPEETQAYWINQAKGDEFKAVELQAQAPLNQKYLAVADENGVPLYFNENGDISTKDKGSLAISSFNTVETAEKEGVNDEIVEQIRGARKNNSTLLIDSFVFAPTKSVEKTYTDTNVVLEETPLEIIQGDGNQALIKIGDKTEPIFGRKLSESDANTILEMVKAIGEGGLIFPKNKKTLTKEEKIDSKNYQRFQFLTNFIFTGTGKGSINFKPNFTSGKYDVTLKDDNNNWYTPTDTELKDYLLNSRITINYDLLKQNLPFTTYELIRGLVRIKKTYPTYSDFVKENTKVAQETISDENAKFYIVAGAIDTTAKAKVEIAENTLPKEETIKNEPGKEEESEIIAEESEEFKPIPLIDFTKKSDSSNNPFSGDLFRNKSLTNKVTEEQKKEAMEWFKNHPISQFITLNQFQHIINSDAFASWNKAAITLWEGSNFTDLYHEAWHEFSQLYLTPKQKKALYNELRSTNPEFKNLSDLEIEEVYKGGIAEDFRKYALSVKEGKPLILGNRPKRNTFFRKIANFLREFITGNVDLQTYYERLYTGNISNYKRDVNNISFPTLNSGVTLGNKTLTATETKNLYKGIDALISDFFTGINTPITVLFAKNNVLNTVYKNVYDKLSSEYKNSVAKYNEQVKNVSTLTEQEKQDLKQLRQTIDNLSVVLSSWKDLVKGHSRFSPYFNATKDKIKFDEDGEIIDTDVLDEDEITRDSSLEKDKNISSKDAASNETTYAVATLPKYDASGKKVPNPFFPFTYETVDFNATWNQLTNATNNTFTYPQLLKKIEELGNKNKSFKDLLEKLPAYKDESGNIVALTDASSRLKSAFFNDVTKPRIEEMELVIELNDKQELVSFYKSAAPTDIDKIKRVWKDNLSKITDYKKELENGEVIFDIDNIVKDYFKFTLKINDAEYKKLSKEEKEEVFVKRIEFLNKLGFDFNPGTLSDPEFIKLIKSNSFNNPALGIFSSIRKNKGDTDFYKDNNNNINKIAEIDLKHTETLSTQSVKNPEGNSVWLIRQWNYMSKIYNALNDRETYPTYKDIIAQKWLSNLDVNVSPYAKGIFLNTLFDLNVGSSTYGNRRFELVGGVNVYPQLTLESYAGVKVRGKAGVQNEGKNTTSLSDFEKLAQNVTTLLTNGVQEHLRYGDKASSFGTRISHIYNPIKNIIEKREVIVPKTEFAYYSYSTKDGFSLKETIPLPDTAFRYFMTALKAEIIPMMRNSKEGIGEEFQFYKDHIKKLAAFEGIISPSTFEKIKKEIIENAEVNELNIDSKLKELAPLIKEDIVNYIEKKAEDLQKELGITNITSLKEVTQILPKSLFSEKVDKEYKQVIPKQIMYAYVVNSFLYNVEHTKIVSSDPRFYKNPQNVIKRLSAWSATGNIFVVDQQTNEYIKSKGNAIKDAVAKKLGITITNPLESNGVLNSVIFNDIKRETVYFKKYIDILAKSGKVSEETLKEWYKAYSKIEEADGQGYVTLDALRESKFRAGSNHWTKEHEEAYQKEAKFLAGESTEGMSQNEIATLFNPEKWQYAGNTQTETVSAPVFYKFSVMPLIPSMIKNTPFEEIHNNLVKQSVGLALFSSGSKASAINNPDGKFNPFYEDYSKRTPYTGEYTINPVHFQHLKEQVNVEPEVKEKVTFSTQMRKLLFLNTFNGGVPIDIPKDMSLEEWDALPESEKLKNSNFYKLEKKFNSLISRKVDIEREKVLNQIGAVKKLTGGYKVDAQKLSDFLKAEFEKRGLPEEVINYFKVNPLTNEFAYPLDASIKRDKIEAIVYSIANRRLVQQKISGDALIQLAASGFEQMKGFENYEEDADLPFYDQEFDKDGNPLPTKAQKIKIAFSSKWKPLLNLSYNGEKIGTRERLNEAIKDDNWLKENRDKISLVAVRIPVQGLNSMESMEIFHFLPESAGNVIVVSPALVAKSGGDFDIDKLTTFFPSLSKNGELYKIPTGQEKIELGKKIKHLKNIFESITKKLDVNDVIENNLRDEIETFVFNLFDENDDIVKEAKKSLDKTLKDIEKLEKFSTKTFKEIEQLSEEISQLDEKKGVENDIISVIKEVLSHPSNFQQLTTPNGTYLLNNKEYGAEWFKENSTEDRDNTFTGLVDFSEIKRQFNSNLVGKASLGIAAVANTFFAISQRAGLYLNPHIRITGENENGAYDFYNFKDKWINFEHNTISKKMQDVVSKEFINKIARVNKKTGKLEAINSLNKDIVEKYNNNEEIDLTSLSGRFAKGKDYQISDVISQFINGFVDVANDDWVFYINAVKEYVPTMLFLTQAGVDVKTTIAFFNQPILKEYLKELQKNKNLFTSLRDKDALAKASERAFATVLAKRQSQLSDSEVIKTIENAKKAKNIPYDLARISSKYSELFTEEKLSSSIYGSSALSADEELLILAHFLDLKNLANNSANLQRSLNADTKKVGSRFAVTEREAIKRDVELSELFPQSIVNKMRNDSAVSAFTNEKTGIDTFVKELFEDVFPLSNNELFNNTLKKLIKNDKALDFKYKFQESAKLATTFVNDFISYIYQKNVFYKNQPILEYVEPLFKPKTSIAKEFLQLKNKFPNLEAQFPVLSLITVDELKDKKGRILKSNLKFKYKLTDKDEIDDSVQNIRQLVNFNNPSYTKEEQLEIQEFTKKLIKFAIVQSGLNNTIFNMNDMIPNEQYTEDLLEGIKATIEAFNNPDKKQAVINRITSFYNQGFKSQNIRFFTQKPVSEEGEGTPFNLNADRGKIFKVGAMDVSTVQTAKAKIKEDFISSLPSITSTYTGKHLNALGKNHITIVEDNLTAKKSSVLQQQGNFVQPLITEISANKPLSDENLTENKQLIDRLVENLINLAFEKKLKIKFPEAVAQNLITSAPDTFRYISERLNSVFGYNNPNYSQEQEVIENNQLLNKVGDEITLIYQGKYKEAENTFKIENITKTEKGYNVILKGKTFKGVVNIDVTIEDGKVISAIRKGYNININLDKGSFDFKFSQEVIEQPIQNKEGIKTLQDVENKAIAVIKSTKGDDKYIFLNSQKGLFGNDLISDDKQGQRLKGKNYKGIDIVSDYFTSKTIKDKSGKDTVDILFVDNKEDAQKQFDNYIKGGAKQFSSIKFVEQPIQNKKGIDFVFEQSPELANSVYEALGFAGNIIQDSKSYYRGQIEEPTIDKDGNLVLYAKEDELYKKAGLKSKGVSMTDDLQSAIDYGNGQLDVAMNLASETYDRDIELERLSTEGYWLIQIPKNISNEIVKEAGEVKIISDKIIIPKGQYKIEQIVAGLETQITPQQKQQAQQLYSQYLDTIFPESKVKDIVYHGTDKVFDTFDFNVNRNFGNITDKNSGMFFSFDINDAAGYGDGTYKNTIKAIIKTKNPIEIKDVIGNQATKYKTTNDAVIGLEPDTSSKNIVVFEPEQIHILGSKQDIEGFKDFVQGKQFQKLTAEEKAKTIEQATKEHRSITALKDLSAKLAHRIGGEVKFENRTNVDWKGYNQGMTSVLNEAYMTPDTPFHEILAHPIIRAIKNKNISKLSGTSKTDFTNLKGFGLTLNSKTDEWEVTYTTSGYDNDRIIVEKTNLKGYKNQQNAVKILKDYSSGNKKVAFENTSLYQNLIKELETGRGKEVFEQVKRDYNIKERKFTNHYIGDGYTTEDTPGETVPFSLEEFKKLPEGIVEKVKQNDYLDITTETINIDGVIYEHTFGEDTTEKVTRRELPKYTLEEQQEEAIVTLLGMMAADKLDAKKDATLISKLKELWKQISYFVKSLLRQDGIKIDELPISTTLNDLAEIMGYGNNKIILPGYKVEYSTPLGNKYETLEEVNNEIRGLADANVEVDLSGVKVNAEDFTNEESLELDYLQNLTDLTKEENDRRIQLLNKSYNQISNFIEKNKEYEQSKEIIEEWKKENNIQYDPEEVYSRGQGFYSSIGAYSNLELDLLLKNLIQHIQDNKKAGGEFTISAFTKPIDKRLKHIEGTGDRVRFVIYPKSEHIKWAAPTDVYSGSVWDASEKVNKDKKSELLGVSFTKAPALGNINEVSPNLADIIDNLSHAHNELGIELTTNNFRIEYDDNIDYSIKKLIDNINKILDDKYGKLKKPEVKTSKKSKYIEEILALFDAQVEIHSQKIIINGVTKPDKFLLKGYSGKLFNTIEEAEEFRQYQLKELRSRISNDLNISLPFTPKKEDYKNLIGIQPTQTRENTTSIESVRDRLYNENYDNQLKNYESAQQGIIPEHYSTYTNLNGELPRKIKVFALNLEKTKNEVGMWQKDEDYDIVKDFIVGEDENKHGVKFWILSNQFKREALNSYKEPIKGINQEKEHTSQAEINLKIAALKEVARKYPRSLITSKVVPINPNMVNSSEIQYSKVGSKQDIEGFKKFVEQPINKEQTVDKTQLQKQNLLFSKNNSETLNQEPQDNQVSLVKNAIKNALPIEISDAITVLKSVPLNILGRSDLFLSLKEILNENGITDEVLINWAGANRSKTGNIKKFKTTEQLTKIIESSLNNLKKESNYPELNENKLALKSFNEWKTALEKYPVAFQEMMFTHAIKYLRKPDRKSKYVLQLSSVALTNAYGIVVNKPHELNRIGKLYDQEVLATVSDATEHEPSASGKGYWVHVPRTEKPTDLLQYEYFDRFELNGDSYTKIDTYRKNGEKITKEEYNKAIGIQKNYLKEKNDNKDVSQYKANIELLRKLSPSTWCTASSMTEHYVQNYDNYILIVDGVTVAGIEAYPENKNEKRIEELKKALEFLKESRDRELETERINKELNNLINNNKRKVKEVTSRANNGIASIDHLDDIKAFFIKHNLDLNNSTIQAAENKKALNKTDSDYTGEDYELIERLYRIERAEEDGLYDRHQADQEYEALEYEYLQRLNNINSVEDALNPQIVFNLDARYFNELPENIKNNKDVATKGVNVDPHNLTYLNENLPFYLDLAKIAVKNEYGIFNYLSEELKQNLELKTLYENGVKETQDRVEAERLRIANLTPEQLANEPDYLPFSKTNVNQIQGYYDTKIDKVIVIADNVSVEEAPKVAIHEVAHRGMVRMAKDLGGVKELAKALFAAEQQLMTKLPELLKRTGHKNLESLMLDYGFTTNSEDGKIKLLSELAARWAETLVNKPKPSWWKKLITDIQNWITKFTGETLNEEQVNELIGGFVEYGSKKLSQEEKFANKLFEEAMNTEQNQIDKKLRTC